MSIRNLSVLGKVKPRSAWHKYAPRLWAGRTPGWTFPSPFLPFALEKPK